MNVTLPSELADALSARAEQRQIPLEDLIREAIAWYLSLDESLIDELAAWQEIHEEARELIEKELE